MTRKHEISVTVNGKNYDAQIESRLLLSDFLRHELELTGTHVGCEQGVCGACTVLFDGQPVRSCILFAVQAHGHEISTVEGMAEGYTGGVAGLQCGFCTPGFLMTLKAFLQESPDPSEAEIREAMSGNLCRCTGYQHIVEAVALAAKSMRGDGS